VTANGNPVPVAELLSLRPAGPVEPWPRDSTPARDSDSDGDSQPSRGSALAAVLSRLRAPDGDRLITWAMAAAVAVVAIDAAIVSYSHIYALATGQQGSGTETGIQPRLLPLSIDGVIVEASLVLLYAARHKLKTPRLARFMLSLGIAATVAANVAHGLPSSLLPPVAHVVIAALLSAWPAGALIGSVEMAMSLVGATQAVADDSDDADDRPEGDSNSDRESDKTPPRPRRSARSRAAAILTRNPKLTDDEVVKRLGVKVSPRTIQRAREDARKAAAGKTT